MNREKIEAAFSRHPEWQISISRFGRLEEINVTTGDGATFLVEQSSRGEVGVSDRNNILEIDFAGHDWVFPDLASAVAFIDQSTRR